MGTPHYDKDVIRDALDVRRIFERYGLKMRRSGTWYRTHECPGCGSGQSAAFAVHENGGFICHRCDLRGHDALSLVALLEGLNVEREFPSVLQTAARIAGINPSERPDPAWIEQRRRERAQRAANQRASERQRRQHARDIAAPLWESLTHRHPEGEAYLASRGLEAFIGRSDVVRFDWAGNIRIPLHDYRGRIVSVPGRRIKPESSADKIVFMRDCPTLGTFGRWPDIKPEHKTVCLCEGLIDYLTGLVMFPDDLVLGAHGAHNIPKIAQGLAPDIKQHGLQLCFVPHIGDRKGAGIKAVGAAIDAATKAGLPMSKIFGFHVHYGDLNDYHLRQRS